MLYTLENDQLLVEVNSRGGELWRIWDKLRQREVLWQGDPQWWTDRSPLLFPNIGRVIGGENTIAGQPWPIPMHGFASGLEAVYEEGEGLRLQIRYTAATLEVYPFPFVLHLGFHLDGRKLTVSWEVENTGDTPMPFSIGGHPGFFLPEGAVYIDFHTVKPLSYRLLTEDNSLLALEEYSLPTKDGKLYLAGHTFDKDALFFLGQEISALTLGCRSGDEVVTLSCPGFPACGIWAKPGRAPYVCLEPWYGADDSVGSDGVFEHKAFVQTAFPHSLQTFSYDILVH